MTRDQSLRILIRRTAPFSRLDCLFVFSLLFYVPFSSESDFDNGMDDCPGFMVN